MTLKLLVYARIAGRGWWLAARYVEIQWWVSMFTQKTEDYSAILEMR